MTFTTTPQEPQMTSRIPGVTAPGSAMRDRRSMGEIAADEYLARKRAERLAAAEKKS
jgi:hypothetical protein